MATERGSWQQRLGRRRALQGLTGCGASLALAAVLGCGKAERPVAPLGPAAAQPKQGGAFTHQSGNEVNTTDFDPHTLNPQKGRNYSLFYQGLLGYHPETYDVEPEIAQRWEQPSPTAYIFTLQPGVKWQNKPPANGRLLTVDDVLFSLERVRTDEPRFTGRTFLDTVDRIEAIPRATIRLTAKRPDASLLSKLAVDYVKVLAPEVVEKAGRFTTPDTAVGTGAFILKSAQERVSAEFVRNPDYWKPGLPYLDQIRTKYFGPTLGGEIAWAAFLAGELDMAIVPGEAAQNYIAKQGPGYTPLWFKNDGLQIVTPNTKVKPFDDPRVTRALRLLIDHEEYRSAWARTWFGLGRYGSVLPTALDTWDLSEEEYSTFLFWKQPKDEAVREALALLSAAGFTRENPLRFELMGISGGGYQEAAAVLLQAQWRRLGQGVVDARLRLHESAVYQQLRARGDYVYGMFTNAPAIVEIDVTLSQIYRTGAARNYWYYSDPKVDDLIDKQSLLFDVRQRKALVRELVSYMADKWPGVVVANRYSLNAVQPHVRNFFPEAYMYGRQYEQVWLDT